MTSRRAWAVIGLLAGAIAAPSVFLLEPTSAIVSCLLGWTMLAIAVSDAERFIVPDVLSLPSIPAGLIATGYLAGQETAHALALEHSVAAAAGALALYGIKQLYYIWRGREGLGLGDVKLAGVAGAWTGLQGLTYVLLLACLVAIAYVALANLRSLRSIEGTLAVPIGVFLGPSIWLVWCVSAMAARI
jgi:leader peptidase (prepilin peptidase) / N-methyltransferase